jgi:hypothetical protein
MILVLDACTISNLIHAFQDTSLIKDLYKCFSEIYIPREVIKEVHSNENAYLTLYNNNWDKLRQLYSDIKLREFIHELDSSKTDCADFFSNFSDKKKLQYKINGEYYSSLLSLFISRLGNSNFNENTNKILFATDDAKAEKLYKELFSSNQIGIIVDSIDIITMFYLKGLLTKTRTIQFIESLIGIYNILIRDLRNEILKLKRNKNTSIRIQLLLTSYLEKIDAYDINEINNILENALYKKIFTTYPKIKDLTKLLIQNQTSKKIQRLKIRRDELINGLIWKV